MRVTVRLVFKDSVKRTQECAKQKEKMMVSTCDMLQRNAICFHKVENVFSGGQEVSLLIFSG